MLRVEGEVSFACAVHANRTHSTREFDIEPILSTSWRIVCSGKDRVPQIASAVLEGYGVFRNGLYHTYVLSSAGDAWGCGGNPNGSQSPLFKGTGDVNLARCIEGGDSAGILYWQTGVCHQIANRILSVISEIIPASAHVLVRGSYFTYRFFGLNKHQRLSVPVDNRWPERSIRCQSSALGTSPSLSGSIEGQAETGVGPMTASNPDPEDIRSLRLELVYLIEAAGLSRTVDEKTLSALVLVQAKLHHDIDELAARLAEKTISRREYLDKLNYLLAETTVAGESLMGRDDFHAAFGDLRASSFGDVDAFLGHPTHLTG